MSGVPYHAWTHAPKEQGGTDPIPAVTDDPTFLPWGWRANVVVQSIPSGVTTQLVLTNGEVAVTDDGAIELLDPVADDDGLQLLRSGFWLVTCAVTWQTATSGQAYVLVNNSSSAVVSGQSETTYLNFNKKHVMIWAHPAYVGSGEVRAYFRQNSGVDKDVYTTRLSAVYLGDYEGSPSGVY